MADDTIIINAGDTTAGKTYDGGDGNDTLALHFDVIGPSNVFDLRDSIIISIETLDFTGSFGGIAKLNASQFGTGISLTGTFSASPGPDNIQVFMAGSIALNLSGITVTGFGDSNNDSISIFGGDGGETISGTKDNDTIAGAGGADTISGNLGNDILDGGAGTDTLDYSYYTNPFGVIVLLDGANEIDVLIDGADDDKIRNFENVIGSSGNDLITGDGAANRLAGGLGNDELNGAGGLDTVDWTAATGAIVFTLDASGGGTTADVAGIGIDTIQNMEGLFGGSANDILTGNAFQNEIAGGGGNDTLRGGLAKDTLVGGAGLHDVADYADKSTAVWATLNRGTNSLVFVNGGVEDTIRQIEDVIGGSANDIILGDAAANFFHGGAGNDILRGGRGIDILDGGVGNGDAADFADMTQALVVTLNGAAEVRVRINGVNADKLRSIENLTGGSGADKLTGDGLANVLVGNGRADTLLGAGGNDRLRGGLGKDILDGGAKKDTADYADKTQGVSVTLNGANNAIVRVGAADEDTIRNIESVIGGSRNDRLTGDAKANGLTGGNGRDTLAGGNGKDMLDGSAGADSLTGDGGRDRLTGGSGSDKFFFAAGFGRDLITDFAAGLAKTDTIAFASALFDTFAEVKAAALVVGGDVVIIFNAANTVTLDGVDSVNDLRPNDFVFV